MCHSSRWGPAAPAQCSRPVAELPNPDAANSKAPPPAPASNGRMSAGQGLGRGETYGLGQSTISSPSQLGSMLPDSPPGSRTPPAAPSPAGETIAAYGGPGQCAGPGTQLSPLAFSPPPGRSADFPSFAYFPTCSYRPPEPVSQADIPAAGLPWAPGSHGDGWTFLSFILQWLDAGDGLGQGRAARLTPAYPKRGPGRQSCLPSKACPACFPL